MKGSPVEGVLAVSFFADFTGKPLMVNFLASRCPTCWEEMDDFQRVYLAEKDRVAFLGLALQETAEVAKMIVDWAGRDLCPRLQSYRGDLPEARKQGHAHHSVLRRAGKDALQPRRWAYRLIYE